MKQPKKRRWIFGGYDETYEYLINSTDTSSLIKLVALSLTNAISGKGVMRAGKRQEGGFLLLLKAPLMLKDILGKEVARNSKCTMKAGRGYNNMSQMYNV